MGNSSSTVNPAVLPSTIWDSDQSVDSDELEAEIPLLFSTLCIICITKPVANPDHVTCSNQCKEKLCKEGPMNDLMCNYCYRRLKKSGSSQCSTQCEESAKTACLLCKSRPKNRRTYLCGKSCKKIVAKWQSYLILEAPPGHITYNMVEAKFIEAWKYSGTAARPPIRKVFKIIGTKSYFAPYNEYREQVGNVKFSYHGTTKTCNLGSPGNTQLCSGSLCALCSLLRTSFKTSCAKSYTAFGRGIYTSTASNKAYNYTDLGRGAMIVSSVALGKVFDVSAFAQVKSCPEGFDSVVFDRGVDGSLNETVVYDDDAIRPVYLIFF